MAKGKKRADLKTDSKLVTAGRREEWTGAVVNPPVWRASTHLYDNVAAQRKGFETNEDGKFFYGRRGAPTQWALAEALTELEPGAFGTVLYPSGVAAIAQSLMAVLSPGDHYLVTDNAYEPTRTMAMGLLKRFGITHSFFDPLDHEAFAAAFTDKTKAVMFESPGSLTMEISDIPALAAITREKGAVSLLDNTWATSLGFPALERGCDISIVSLTKHVGGHSDLMMGAATAGERWYQRLRLTGQQLGNVVSPDDAALALRGLRSMGVRLERGTHSALTIAKWLDQRDDVALVQFPALPGAPGHELWQRDFTGACGLFSFVLKDASLAQRDVLVDTLSMFGIGYSWGGFESLALPMHPDKCRSIMPWPLPELGGGSGAAIRLSIGLEDPVDLIEDLDNAFQTMGNA
ncbi:cystathionine beta-lyase [Altererythrobacter sp. MF3-039]|uniref:cystathionine beta-lyase n=1 Tax=Altererythrobacter sp. MF3-039 TaxID=3252901 RepID=UPI00390C543D